MSMQTIEDANPWSQMPKDAAERIVAVKIEGDQHWTSLQFATVVGEPEVHRPEGATPDSPVKGLWTLKPTSGGGGTMIVRASAIQAIRLRDAGS